MTFAEMVQGIHPDVVAYREYVLAEIRLALQRAKMLVKEIEHIGVTLGKGIIDPDMAVEWLAEANALDFLIPTEPEWRRDGEARLPDDRSIER
jgi:hypothetical protein